MGDIRSCTVSFRDQDGISHAVEVTAETLYEAAIVGMKALKVAGWENAPNLKIEIRVKSPETTHEIWNSALAAWLARNGRTPREQALKVRLRELIQAR